MYGAWWGALVVPGAGYEGNPVLVSCDCAVLSKLDVIRYRCLLAWPRINNPDASRAGFWLMTNERCLFYWRAKGCERSSYRHTFLFYVFVCCASPCALISQARLGYV